MTSIVIEILQVSGAFVVTALCLCRMNLLGPMHRVWVRVAYCATFTGAVAMMLEPWIPYYESNTAMVLVMWGIALVFWTNRHDWLKGVPKWMEDEKEEPA